MESESQEKPLGAPLFKVYWHSETKSDLKKLNPGLVEDIVEGAQSKLSRAPQFLGEPLKGTSNKLWKVAYSKYRIVYTIVDIKKEVWILSVQKREIIYKNKHIIDLLRLAIAIQQSVVAKNPTLNLKNRVNPIRFNASTAPPF